MNYNRKGFSDKQLLSIYEQLLTPRLVEERMLILLRQGKVSKWFSGIGQEAISVGVALALEREEFIFPMHRNLGVFTAREVPMHRLFAQFQGKKQGYTKGRDRSFHFGVPEQHIIGMISHLGPQLSLADGVGLAHKLSKEQSVVAAFTGDGATSQGEFHEALNVGAVWDLPVLYIIENNGYGLSTPSKEQFKCKQFIDKGIGYGMEVIQLDGNNILEVIKGIRKIAHKMRKNPRPVLVECITFRMRGHEEASGVKYVPEKLLKQWEEKDPVANFEQFLLQTGVLIEKEKENIHQKINQSILQAWKTADAYPFELNPEQQEVDDLYQSHTHVPISAQEEKVEMRLVDAISDGLKESMLKHPNLVLMGQDIAEYGGVFKVTEGFVEEFGSERVRNTPLCESAIVGAALGLSIMGYKSMVEMQFADFVSCGFNQIVNSLAKVHYRWRQNADVVIRMPTGAGVSAGPFHSQSNEAWFFHVPGLKIVYPAFAHEAKGLLIESINDPNPILFFEHKALYRSTKSMVPKGYYNLPLGKAARMNEGNEISVITYGSGVHWMMEFIENHTNYSIDLINLRSLAPLDWEMVFESVKKCGKVLVLHEDNLTGGIGGEISSRIGEECFSYLDAPVKRLGSLDTPVPFQANQEKMFLASAKLAAVLQELKAY